MADDLIFDLGMHRGDDSDFYLRKGFRVVAVEANAALCKLAEERFVSEIAVGQLTIVNKALDRIGAGRVTFYLNPAKDDWGSLDPDMAGRSSNELSTIEVETTTLGMLFATYGVPYYLKCDIEGADEVAIEQLETEILRPRYVSVEASGDPLETLSRCGYDRFQIVNQGYLRLFPSPDPPREGRLAEQHFTQHISGLFGQELVPSAWADAATTARRLSRWRALNERRVNPVTSRILKKIGKLTRRTWLIGSGWIDIHARLAGFVVMLNIAA